MIAVSTFYSLIAPDMVQSTYPVCIHFWRMTGSLLKFTLLSAVTTSFYHFRPYQQLSPQQFKTFSTLSTLATLRHRSQYGPDIRHQAVSTSKHFFRATELTYHMAASSTMRYFPMLQFRPLPVNSNATKSSSAANQNTLTLSVARTANPRSANKLPFPSRTTIQLALKRSCVTFMGSPIGRLMMSLLSLRKQLIAKHHGTCLCSWPHRSTCSQSLRQKRSRAYRASRPFSIWIATTMEL